MKNALPLVTVLWIFGPACAPEGVDDEAPPAIDDPVAEGPAVAETEKQRILNQLPGRDLSLQPPRIEAMTVESGRLEVTFKEPMPATLDFIHDGHVLTLRDDGAGADRRAGDGRYTAELPPSPTLIAATGSHLVTPGKALLITDPVVVNNYYRTTDPCHPPAKPHSTDPSPPADDAKKWTFGYLMTQMANQSATNVSPSTFASKWLVEWAADHTAAKKNQVNGQDLKEIDAAGLGHTVAKTIKAQWLKASGNTGTLSMKKAPFRLLAIVNRFDKRDNTAFGGGTAGELRFVFGVLNLEKKASDGTCLYLSDVGDGTPDGSTTSENNVILEYAVDKSSDTAIRDYASSWFALESKALGGSDYLNALQKITEGVVTKGKGTVKARANGSALNVLRTNETNDGLAWDLREFAINKTSHVFKSSTVSQTPRVALNDSDDLNYWANFWAEEILDDRHFVPLKFATDENRTYQNTYFRAVHAATDDAPVSISSDFPSDIRHHLSLNTCAGCHAQENVVNTPPPMHVVGQRWGLAATLSPFLVGDGAGNPYQAPDPLTGDPRPFFDLDRRRQDLSDYLDGTALSALAFRPLARVH